MELLSLGSEVEVLEPQSLRKEIGKQLKEALGYYQ
jgi:predicted DNA-binding transcriptional regulator YafY